MPRDRDRDATRPGERDVTPSRLPDTTPPLMYPGPDYSFTLQAIMEMQKTLGQLTQSVTTFTDQIKKHDEKLDQVSHKVYAAEVVIVVVGGIISILGTFMYFLLSKMWDTLSPLVKFSVGK